MCTNKIDKLNTLTILKEKKCPNCGTKNNSKTLIFKESDPIEERIRKEIEATKCDCCGFDIYNYKKRLLQL